MIAMSDGSGDDLRYAGVWTDGAEDSNKVLYRGDQRLEARSLGGRDIELQAHLHCVRGLADLSRRWGEGEGVGTEPKRGGTRADPAS